MPNTEHTPKCLACNFAVGYSSYRDRQTQKDSLFMKIVEGSTHVTCYARTRLIRQHVLNAKQKGELWP